jgi:superfamily II DNA or RNA helicase
MHQPWTSDTLLLSEIRDEVKRLFHHRPCLWQIRVVQAILKNDKDIASISATGSGKTLTFWMPLLFIPEGIQIVVTPLNILGKQNVDTLTKVGINAVSVTADSATAATFQVRKCSSKIDKECVHGFTGNHRRKASCNCYQHRNNLKSWSIFFLHDVICPSKY